MFPQRNGYSPKVTPLPINREKEMRFHQETLRCIGIAHRIKEHIGELETRVALGTTIISERRLQEFLQRQYGTGFDANATIASLIGYGFLQTISHGTTGGSYQFISRVNLE